MLLRNYIDGQWVEAHSKQQIDVINPATGEVLCQAVKGGRTDAEAAITAAKNSFYKTREWRDMCATDRANILFDISDVMENELEEFAYIDCINHGKPLREAREDAVAAIECFRYYAGLISKPYGGVYDVNNGTGEMHSYTIHEPIGVCGLITPWNYPLLMAVWKLAPALAAGNSVILKPASVTPMSAVKLFEIFERKGIPAGAANLVMGSGSAVGNTLAESRDVELIAFTGSTEVGQSIGRAAMSNVKRIGLELGGKSPFVIFSDADLEQTVEWAMFGIFFNQGEICSATSRIIVEESFHDEFVKRFLERTNKMTIGNPLEDPDIGAIVSEDQMKTVLKHIETAKKEGAVCLCGGERYVKNECSKGFFIRPTIFDKCTSDMKIVNEEVFGPVVTIQTFKTEQEAVDMANDTPFGLGAAVATRNISRAIRVIKEIRAGNTWINCSQPTFNEAPWGGYKMSGIGRELGVHGLEEYQEIKQININLSESPLGWYSDR